MSSFVCCPECGNAIGEYQLFFNEAKKEFMKHHLKKLDPKNDINILNLAARSNTLPPVEPIFDAIGIKLSCCRMHINTVHRGDH